MASRFHHAADSASRHRLLSNSPGECLSDQLEPRPDVAHLSSDETPPQARLRRPVTHATRRGEFIDSRTDRPSSAGASSKMSQLPMFPGPPPPISASKMINSASSRWENDRHSRGTSESSSVLVDRRREGLVSQASHSAWQGLRRKQRGLEQEIQCLLDLQAVALVAGSSGSLDTGSVGNRDAGSEEESTTPTDAFSTASVRSRMHKSLYIPLRSTPEGNVIPVRQPAKSRRIGLLAARNGIQESLAALAHLGREEDAYTSAALSERKAALARLDSLDTKRMQIYDALKVLEIDDEEPLGQELRKLGLEHESIDDEIRQLEGKLVGMRTRRRWLQQRIDDVKSKRAAGLSGYRGALKDVDVEVSAILRRPPIQPLDQEMLGRGKGFNEERSAGGREFMRLIPRRRTVEIAKAWWEAEIEVLEQQRAQIGEEQRALEQGSIIWQEVIALVTHFESRLRETMKAETGLSTASLVLNGRKTSPRQDLIRSELPLMGEVVAGLAQHLQVAENKQWNLLICAIGAEWEAFKEAHDVLRGIVDGADDGVAGEASSAADEPDDDVPRDHGEPGQDEVHAESDNEVPTDLLISRLNDPEREHVKEQSDHAAARKRRDSGNDVPPEFLAEHDHCEDLQVLP